jgi:hypothetical protein
MSLLCSAKSLRNRHQNRGIFIGGGVALKIDRWRSASRLKPIIYYRRRRHSGLAIFIGWRLQ